jgi:hypothetical protein
LLVAHRKEILQQEATFQGVLKDNNFGDLWVDGLNQVLMNIVLFDLKVISHRTIMTLLF